eukprot:CAMPEP_0178931090 /NCGR_PEP_ID=MMETSP0786-20121207/21695_1 /TAXON_ID=186022 /ORGANISM="Thalassionema frauenfeldii, Strain CCMP 1798" /LENGTH=237 /DNA_ID=CAMNT_0020607885 /DNA_START=103 /DNA_END=817 /DNA_ORIENTATION=+
MLASMDTDDPVVKQIESTLGKRALLDDAIIHGSSANENNEADFLDMRIPSQLIHCHGCGAWLQGRIRIQPIQRGRTRRRRASRRKAALKRRELRESKQQSKNRHHTSGSCGMQMMKIDPKEWNHLFQVTDGMCKNIIVQMCNYCGFQSKRKGTMISKNYKKKCQQTNETTTPVDNDYSDRNFIKDYSMDRNFIKIGRADKKDTTSSPPKFLISDQRKKKRKKMDKTNLMNFLSSLND